MKEQGRIFYSSDPFIGGTVESGKIEFEAAKEILIPNFDVCFLSGESGAGKSTYGKKLAEKLGIRIRDIGDEIRNKTTEQTGEVSVGFAARKIDVDIEFDKLIVDIIRNSIIEGPIILVARMGPWIAKKEEAIARENYLFFPNVVSINFSASPKVKRDRIRIRERIKHPEMTIHQIDCRTFLGNKKNQENWHLAHPDLVGNPLDPLAQYDGRDIYNIKVNNDGLDANQNYLKTNEELIKENYLLKKAA